MEALYIETDKPIINNLTVKASLWICQGYSRERAPQCHGTCKRPSNSGTLPGWIAWSELIADSSSAESHLCPYL